MIVALTFVLFVFILYEIYHYLEKRNKYRKFVPISTIERDKKIKEEAVFSNLNGPKITEYISRSIKVVQGQLGQKYSGKIIKFYILLVMLCVFISKYTGLDLIETLLVVLPSMSLLSFLYINRRHRREFAKSFPDALNLLSGSISSGDSLINSLRYVSEACDNRAGKEFRWISDRLAIGESPAEVFKKANARVSFLEYNFFISALKINVETGSQLSAIIKKIDRIIFNAHALDMKKNALTSEARTSAKILMLIPFFFLGLMRWLSPENFNFLFENPTGHLLVGYMIGSEFVGWLVIQLLLKGVDA